MQPLPYWRLSATYFCYYAAVGVFTPYFARWITTLGHSAQAASALMSLWYATRVVGPPLFAHLARHSQTPRTWLIAGLALSCAGFFGFFLPQSLFWLALSMGLFSLFYNAVMPQLEALTLNALGDRKHDYGRIRLWGSLGFIVLAVIYGELLQRRLAPDLAITMLAGMLVTTLVATRLPVELQARSAVIDHAHAERPDARQSLTALLRRRPIQRFLATTLLMQLSFGAFYLFYTLHLEQAGHNTNVVGALWGVGVLAEIVLFIYAGRILARATALFWMRLAILTTAFRWVCVALLPDSLWLMVVMQLSHAVSFGLFHIASTQRLVELFSAADRVNGQSLNYSIGSGVGGVLGAALAGWAWGIGSGRVAFLLAALCAGLALLPSRGQQTATADHHQG